MAAEPWRRRPWLRPGAQEEDIRWLWAEVHRLKDEQLNAPDRCQAEGPCLTREVSGVLLFVVMGMSYYLSLFLSLLLVKAKKRTLKRRRKASLTVREHLVGAKEEYLAPRGSIWLSSDEWRSDQRTEEDGVSSQAEIVYMWKRAMPLGVELKNQPDFVKERLKLFEILKKEHQLLLAIYDKKGDTSNVITVRVADGKTVEGEAWKTTPYDVAAEISQELAEDTVVAKVNGELWDLDRPLEGDSTLELLLFDNEEAQAGAAGSACYQHPGPVQQGLLMASHEFRALVLVIPLRIDQLVLVEAVSSEELSALENLCKAIIQEKQPFERLEVSKDVLLDMFKYNKFKCCILNEKVNTPTTTVYR
ncbi:Threonine--tRNA ligase 2; cytoplasmic [Camelus dromedarius]|nr:Threonine--tRNA ligase 2; cytoplasmic [Camelus dromedarius]KAB1257107.1 Threonine--tRNA ligase 2; cytoplasmic [Camelus dromedarius]